MSLALFYALYNSVKEELSVSPLLHVPKCAEFLSTRSVRSEWASDPEILGSPATRLHCLPPALASEQVLHSTHSSPSSKGEVYCGKCWSRIFVVSATSMRPSSLPDRHSFLFWWVSHPVIFMIFSWISSLKEDFFIFNIRLILTSHLWTLCWSFPSVVFTLPMPVFRLGKHQSILILSKCKHPNTRTHGWLIVHSYTIGSVHSSL